jgi:hypothetical protein
MVAFEAGILDEEPVAQEAGGMTYVVVRTEAQER